MYMPDLIQSLPASGVELVRILPVAADVRIETSPRRDIRILAEGLNNQSELIPVLRRDGNILIVSGADESALALLQQTARIQLTIQLPESLIVSVSILAGSLQLEGSFARLDVRVRFGSVSGCAEARYLKVRVFAGDVRLGGLTGSADVQLSLGDVTLAWARLSVGERVMARTFVGDAILDLPEHMTLSGSYVVDERAAAWDPALRITDTLETAGLSLG